MCGRPDHWCWFMTERRQRRRRLDLDLDLQQFLGQFVCRHSPALAPLRGSAGGCGLPWGTLRAHVHVPLHILVLPDLTPERLLRSECIGQPAREGRIVTVGRPIPAPAAVSITVTAVGALFSSLVAVVVWASVEEWSILAPLCPLGFRLRFLSLRSPAPHATLSMSVDSSEPCDFAVAARTILNPNLPLRMRCHARKKQHQGGG